MKYIISYKQKFVKVFRKINKNNHLLQTTTNRIAIIVDFIVLWFTYATLIVFSNAIRRKIMPQTVKQIAGDLKITKQAVLKRMDEIDDFRELYTTKVGNRLEVDEVGVELLTKFNNDNRQKRQEKQQNQQPKNDKSTTKQDDKLITTLINQLTTKDEQIAQLQKALDQQQQLQLATVQENQQLKGKIQELGGYIETDIETQKQQTINNQVTDEDLNKPKKNKRHWWKFGK